MSRQHILISQPIAEEGVAILKRYFSVTMARRHLKPRELLRSLRGVDALVCSVNDTISKAVVDHAPALRCISNVAVGFNNIDIVAAGARGILVTNTPDTLTRSVAEFVFAHMLVAARHIFAADHYIRQGKFKEWSLTFFLGGELYGKTLGIVGFGTIGKALLPLATGFGMRVIYTRRTGNEKKYRNAFRRTFRSVLEDADYIVLLVPLTTETRHLITQKEISLMKKSAVLVNMARGGVVAEKDLAQALRRGDIKAACLDVFEYEPAVSAELLKMGNIVLTPHLGSATVEARKRMAIMAAHNVIDVVLKNKCKNSVNDHLLKKQHILLVKGKPFNS